MSREIIVKCDVCGGEFDHDDFILDTEIRILAHLSIGDKNRATIKGEYCGAKCLSARIADVLKELKK